MAAHPHSPGVRLTEASGPICSASCRRKHRARAASIPRPDAFDPMHVVSRYCSPSSRCSPVQMRTRPPIWTPRKSTGTSWPPSRRRCGQSTAMAAAIRALGLASPQWTHGRSRAACGRARRSRRRVTNGSIGADSLATHGLAWRLDVFWKKTQCLCVAVMRPAFAVLRVSQCLRADRRVPLAY